MTSVGDGIRRARFLGGSGSRSKEKEPGEGVGIRRSRGLGWLGLWGVGGLSGGGGPARSSG